MIKHWINEARFGRGLLGMRAVRRALRELRLPAIRPLWAVVGASVRGVEGLLHGLATFCYRDPVFRSRCDRAGRRLVLEGQIPQVIGDGRIEVGDDVRIGTRNTWVVGLKISTDPALLIGDRTSINYQTIISVARRVTIGNDVMIAGNTQIFDNPSHPVSPARRLAHDSIALDDAREVTIGDNVWIGSNALILRASVGANSIVAAGSVVTKDVPANTLVAGNPARVIRDISDQAPLPLAERASLAEPTPS
ncbi:MAG: hypothetical protein IPK12_15105 [Gemmatimonadetes bacterium]|nr:hypothetical protein [Gemmatimonadota bacterium]